MLNFPNIIDLEEYINYSEEKYITGMLSNQEIINQITYLEPETAEDDEEDDSTELPQVNYKEALDAIRLLELYLMQQNLSNAVHIEHDSALSKLNRELDFEHVSREDQSKINDSRENKSEIIELSNNDQMLEIIEISIDKEDQTLEIIELSSDKVLFEKEQIAVSRDQTFETAKIKLNL
ncbi:2286_t:CDS:2 [Cetraspora pellucida]|uniref:2286_t:CDS:1 n=1 Tax=Cetraspora pellucida TaxID=1433469 RepID=A0ACA9KFM6_9GLOM|nr:2286_t:CDS:2 [Cetraspora pellucida]